MAGHSVLLIAAIALAASGNMMFLLFGGRYPEPVNRYDVAQLLPDYFRPQELMV